MAALKLNQWQVYIVQCADDTLYTGVTNHLDQRLENHNSGKGAKYTRVRLPVKLVYAEVCKNRSAASQREWAIKQFSRLDKLKLIASSA